MLITTPTFLLALALSSPASAQSFELYDPCPDVCTRDTTFLRNADGSLADCPILPDGSLGANATIVETCEIWVPIASASGPETCSLVDQPVTRTWQDCVSDPTDLEVPIWETPDGACPPV